MEPGNSSAEKELLKAIEGKADLSKTRPEAAGLKKLPALDSQLEQFAQSARGVALRMANMGAAGVNKALLVTIIVLALIYALVFAGGMRQLKHIPRFDASAAAEKQVSGKAALFALKDYSYYIDILLGRNIFNPLEEKKADVSVSLSKVADMAKSLRLAGISWAENMKERYVMIEDIAAKVTYFLQEGDRISGLTVKNIYRDRVTLGAADDTIDLR
ncbi:MAG: hypothetical protein WC592_06435 [Candidatus Omnitrophota bacterium]|nr:hypothetical protein [Candidatus Omnitrophota bacterium]